MRSLPIQWVHYIIIFPFNGIKIEKFHFVWAEKKGEKSSSSTFSCVVKSSIWLSSLLFLASSVFMLFLYESEFSCWWKGAKFAKKMNGNVWCKLFVRSRYLLKRWLQIISLQKIQFNVVLPFIKSIVFLCVTLISKQWLTKFNSKPT